jgi:phosphatidylserine/phosphatidylglycerophosphate/cardiolipin synthase-like enzyme
VAPLKTVFLADGGQTADSVATLVAGFLDGASKTVEMAIYDLVLAGEPEQIVAGALTRAIARGVQVRLAYNQDHRAPIPVPPPPTPGVLGSDAIRNLPGLQHRSIPGIPDLMHHKFVSVDGHALWTGSTNWTNDSWTREENVIVTLDSPELAAAYLHVFEELWDGRDVAASGHVKPEWVALGGGVSVRAYFTPAHALPMVAEIAHRIGAARRRVRICSPVITSGPLLGTLADLVERRSPVDVKGVFDATQMDEVRYQWSANPASQWKLQALDCILHAIPFSAKVSTPWGPGTVHDYMHAKCVVADDTVFVGSYNLSRSGESNAENVLEFTSQELADTFAGYIDSIIARYPPAAAGGAAGGAASGNR